MHSSRFLGAALCAGAVLSGLPALAAPASSAPGASGCSLKSLSGTYLFWGEGTTSPDGDGTWAPKAVLQQMTFSGDGQVDVSWGRVANRIGDGQIYDIPAGTTGAYTLAADCTGEIQITQGPTFDFVTATRGHTVRFVQVDPWNVLIGTMQRVGR